MLGWFEKRQRKLENPRIMKKNIRSILATAGMLVSLVLLWKYVPQKEWPAVVAFAIVGFISFYAWATRPAAYFYRLQDMRCRRHRPLLPSWLQTPFRRFKIWRLTRKYNRLSKNEDADLYSIEKTLSLLRAEEDSITRGVGVLTDTSTFVKVTARVEKGRHLEPIYPSQVEEKDSRPPGRAASLLAQMAKDEAETRAKLSEQGKRDGIVLVA